MSAQVTCDVDLVAFMVGQVHVLAHDVSVVGAAGPCDPFDPSGPAGLGGPAGPISPVSPLDPCDPCGPCDPARLVGPTSLVLEALLVPDVH